MKSFNIIIYNFKKNFITICICLFVLLLLIFSNTILISAQNGLNLWATSVVPTLFPFLIATELLGYTNITSFIEKLLNPFMKPIFNVPGIGAFPFIIGIITGYPVAAKIISNLKLQKKITNIEAERLISFTNNSGPLFIIGTVGISFFKNASIGFLLFLTHMFACLSVGFIFRLWKSGNREYNKTPKSSIPQEKISFVNLGEIISCSIMSSINTIFLIGGFIVLFSVILSIFENCGILHILSNLLMPILYIFNVPINYSNGIVCGIMELTNGIYKIALIPNKHMSINIIICAFLLGFGGISVSLQILSVISKAKISIKPYIIGKLLQGIFAAVYTYLIIYFIPIFNLDL